jgi:hypothetical protein
MKIAQIMQQQIEQERATHAELQQAIEALRKQEHEPSTQDPSSQQPSLQQQTLSQKPQRQQCHLTQGIIDNKCPLADNVQLGPMVPSIESSTSTKILQRVRALQIPHALWGCESLSWGRQYNPRQVIHYITRECIN